jgi:hypothetical protein
MPVNQFLNGFDPETKRIVALAFEMVRIALRLTERSDRINELIAEKVIELAKAKAGETSPDLLCEKALAYFRAPVSQAASGDIAASILPDFAAATGGR